jgi:hypothetical protein
MDERSGRHHRDRGVSVDEVLRRAEALPDTAWVPAGDHLVLKVRGRSFGYMAADERTLMLKATREEQDALVAADPRAYGRSYGSGRFGWVAVRLAEVPGDELVELLTEAWRLTAPRPLVAAYPGAGP